MTFILLSVPLFLKSPKGLLVPYSPQYHTLGHMRLCAFPLGNTSHSLSLRFYSYFMGLISHTPAMGQTPTLRMSLTASEWNRARVGRGPCTCHSLLSGDRAGSLLPSSHLFSQEQELKIRTALGLKVFPSMPQLD